MGGDIGIPKLAGVIGVTATAGVNSLRHVTVSVDSAAWDDVLTGDFREMLAKMDPATGYRSDLTTDGLVMGRGYRVLGVTADLDFKKTFADSVKANVLKINATANARWASGDSSVLHVKIPGPVYLAAEMWEWKNGNFQGGRPPVLQVSPTASVGASRSMP